MSQSTPSISNPVNDGRVFCEAAEDALEACVSGHAGAALPSYKTKGTLWYNETLDVYELYDGANSIVFMRVDEANHHAAVIPQNVTYADDATPSVKGVASLELASTGANTITAWDDGTEGQILTVRATNANDTIASGLTATGMTIPLIAGDTLQWIYDGAAWRQIGGSVGMGRCVPLVPGAVVTDKPGPAVAAWADVDLSKDGVRKGAVSALIALQTKGGMVSGLYCRQKGDATAAGVVNAWGIVELTYNKSVIKTPIDNDAKCQMYWSVDWTAGLVVNDMVVHEYYI